MARAADTDHELKDESKHKARKNPVKRVYYLVDASRQDNTMLLLSGPVEDDAEFVERIEQLGGAILEMRVAAPPQDVDQRDVVAEADMAVERAEAERLREVRKKLRPNESEEDRETIVAREAKAAANRR